MGTFYNNVWLPAAVQAPSAHVQGHSFLSPTRPTAATGSSKRDRYTVKKRGNQGDKAERTAEWLLFELLPCSETGQWVPPDTRFETIERLPPAVTFQDALHQADYPVSPG